MKNKKTEIAFFLFGLAIFIYLIRRFGIEQVSSDIAGAGWSLLGAVLVWLAIYFLNTLSWKFALGSEGKNISFLHLMMVNVSGFSIDTITPVVALGGEPYKVKALSSSMGTRQALSAVILFRMVHTVGHMLMLLTGIVGGLLVLSLPAALDWMLAIGGGVMAVVLAVMFSGFRDGVFQRLERFVGKLKLLGRFSTVLKAHEHSLHEMDHVVTDAYRNRKGKFYASVFFEYLCRACMGIEVYLILHGAGVDISMMSALFLYVAYSVIINLVFFIPLNLGVREGGLYLGLESLALPPMLGIYLGIVIRIREFIWILIGLLLILVLARMNTKTVPYSESTSVGKLP